MTVASKNSVAISQQLAQTISGLSVAKFPSEIERTAYRMLLDIVGICVSARKETYVNSCLNSFDDTGVSTVIGHAGSRSAGCAAAINGVAAHGEDFDDTYEGGPVHAGVVIIPALLAAAEKHKLSGEAVLKGIAVGVEVMCRLCAVAPTKVHKAGFHPTGVFGAIGAAAGVGAAMNLSKDQLVNAFGIAASMSSGIIEYLSDGTWTKRLHPGWAAQSGYRAARLAGEGFLGPVTVFEGSHGLFYAFSRSAEGNFAEMMRGFGEEWRATTVAFKPYACGTMTHPYIDCARELRKQGVTAQNLEKIECETAEGIVHRLWEPLDIKQTPANEYSAKFSTPYGVALGIVRDDAGLNDYTATAVKDPEILSVSQKVRYIVDPANPYPKQFTGHVKAYLKDGRVLEARQGFFRGGVDAPLTDDELTKKFYSNCRFGGWNDGLARDVEAKLKGLFGQGTLDLSLLRQ
jgi:2-methylcitrate dehydratase PrpD